MRKPNSPDLTLPAGIGVRNGISIKIGRPANWSIERCLATLKIFGPWVCWKPRSALRNGYSRLSVKNRSVAGHRVIYEYLIGPVSPLLTLDHLCRNRWCVNPNHLEPVTERVNIQRGISFAAVNALKTSCPKGHHYDSTKNSTGERYCLICGRAAQLHRRRARGAKAQRLIPYADIAHLRREGKSYKTIKRTLHVTAGAIAQAVLRYGLPRTKRLAQAVRITRVERSREA